jgi:hypothetical protein
MICWHRWGKYSDPKNGIYAAHDGAIGYFAVCQMRVCEKCCKADVKRLPQLRSLDELRKEK